MSKIQPIISLLATQRSLALPLFKFLKRKKKNSNIYLLGLDPLVQVTLELATCLLPSYSTSCAKKGTRLLWWGRGWEGRESTPKEADIALDGQPGDRKEHRSFR